MNKNVRIITLVVVIMVIVLASVIAVTVSATTHGDKISSKGFVVTTSGGEATITSYSGTDKTVLIPAVINGKKVVSVGANAFKGKTIESIEFSDKIKNLEIEDNAFVGIEGVKYIKLPTNTTKIGDNAFKDLRYLSHVTMPDSIRAIGEYAFSGCRALRYTNGQPNDTFRLPSELVTIGDYAFQSVGFEKVIFGDKLQNIGASAFSDSDLVDVILGANNNVKTIGKQAFYSTSLRSTTEKPLTFPQLESIGDGAFSSISSNFVYFKICSKVTTIGDSAFAVNRSLDEVEFDPAVKITSFGKSVFAGATRLKKVSLTGDKTGSSDIRSTLPDCVTTIPDLTFNGCHQLLNERPFIIGAKVTAIGDGAFSIYDKVDSESNLSYTKQELKVAPENESFKMVALGSFKQDGVTSEPDLKHAVLTNKAATELIAYIGKYSNESYRKEVDDAEAPNGTRRLTAFTFLYEQNELKDNLTTIRGYAFAGVKFKQFVAIPRVTEIGAYAFKNSNIEVVFVENEKCKFDLKAFDGMVADTSIASTMLYPAISEQLDKINAGSKLNLKFVTMDVTRL
ncbi:MAG: leucine-rich repeat protein [Clostridia bacterium]